MRHTLAWLALVALLIASAAATASAQMAPLPGSTPIAITINGEAQHFITPPIMMNGQVLVPMRDVFEALNATVVWHGDAKAVTAHNSDTVSLQIGSPDALVGQRPVTLAMAPMLYEDRTYVPLQFVHDALGAQVAFDATGQTITIASAMPAVASAEAVAPQQLAEAEPQVVAPAQPMVPPAGQQPVCPPGYVPVQPQGQVMSQGQMRPQAQAPVAAEPYGSDPPAQTQVVTVILTEFKITVTPTEVHPGQVTLQVRNEGRDTHGLAIESTDLRTPNLKPGQAAALTFTAQSGKTYTLYCPVDAHKELGMKTRLPVR
jgi:hypothetical protein